MSSGSVRDILPRWFLAALAAALLIVTVSLVYSRVVHAPFIFDDLTSVVHNPSIRHLWPAESASADARPLSVSPVYARPLVNLSFALNYRFGELDPAGYHIVNIVLHSISAMLVWSVVARTLRLDYFVGRFDRAAGPLGFAVALIWAVHPLSSESGAYITQRTELMMGLFYLATFYCSLRYWAAAGRGARAAWVALAATCCLLGALSKETMATAPVMVLLFDRTFIGGSLRRAFGKSWPLYLGLSLGWIPLIVLYGSGTRTPAAGFGLGVSAQEWWFTQSKVLFLYLKLAAWPSPLQIHYEMPYLTFSEAWPFLLAFMAIVMTTACLLWRRSAFGFAVAWVLVLLSPTLVVPLVNEVAAERRMYLPLVAIVATAVVGGYTLVRKMAQGKSQLVPTATLAALVCGIVVVFALVTSRRLDAYQSELALWEDAAQYQPDSYMTNLHVGIELAAVGRTDEAIDYLERALAAQPVSAVAHFNLAHALAEVARGEDAIEHYREAIRLKPQMPEPYNDIGLLLVRMGKGEQALEYYGQALEKQPDFPKAHNNLAVALANLGRMEEAVPHFKAAAELGDDPESYVNLMTAYALLNRPAEAAAAGAKALALARRHGRSELARQLELWLSENRPPERP